MRISAFGLESTIAVAIDQIFRFAPSIRPPIEPVVSRTKATSTVGFATAADIPAERDAARAKTKVRIPMRGIVVLLQCFVPSEPRFHRLHGPVRSKTRRLRYEFAAELAPTVHVRQAGNRLGSGNGIARPPDQPRARAGSPPVGDGAPDCARHRAAATVVGVFLHQRIAVALGAPGRSGGLERARRNLDRRDQVLGGGFARRPEMAGLTDAL